MLLLWNNWLRLFKGNSIASRKKLLPIVKDFLKEREGGGCLGDGCLGDVEEEDEDSCFPPTPMNSLAEGCPLDNGLPHISALDLEEKFSKMAERRGNWPLTSGLSVVSLMTTVSPTPKNISILDSSHFLYYSNTGFYSKTILWTNFCPFKIKCHMLVSVFAWTVFSTRGYVHTEHEIYSCHLSFVLSFILSIKSNDRLKNSYNNDGSNSIRFFVM